MDLKQLFAPVAILTEQMVEQEKAALKLKASVSTLSERVAKLEDEMMPGEEWDEHHP